MNGGIFTLGILMLIGMFFLSNVYITPQQRNQIELSSSACGSSLGTWAGALSSDVAEQCRTLQNVGQILAVEKYVYLGGFGILVLGLLIPGRKKEVIIREIVREPKEIEEAEIETSSEREDTPVPKANLYVCNKCKMKVSENDEFCPNCGNRLNKFCSKCGTKIKGRFCANCGKKA